MVFESILLYFFYTIRTPIRYVVCLMIANTWTYISLYTSGVLLDFYIACAVIWWSNRPAPPPPRGGGGGGGGVHLTTHWTLTTAILFYIILTSFCYYIYRSLVMGFWQCKQMALWQTKLFSNRMSWVTLWGSRIHIHDCQVDFSTKISVNMF